MSPAHHLPRRLSSWIYRTHVYTGRPRVHSTDSLSHAYPNYDQFCPGAHPYVTWGWRFEKPSSRCGKSVTRRFSAREYCPQHHRLSIADNCSTYQPTVSVYLFADIGGFFQKPSGCTIGNTLTFFHTKIVLDLNNGFSLDISLMGISGDSRSRILLNASLPKAKIVIGLTIAISSFRYCKHSFLAFCLSVSANLLFSGSGHLYACVK